MHTTCPTSLLPSNIVLVAGVVLGVWGLVESIPPLLAHPAHHRLPQRLMIGVPLLVADAAAAYLLVRGSLVAGIGVGAFAGVVALLGAGKLEKSLIADETLTDAERAAAIKRAGRVSRLVRSFVIAALAAVVAVGALPL